MWDLWGRLMSCRQGLLTGSEAALSAVGRRVPLVDLLHHRGDLTGVGMIVGLWGLLLLMVLPRAVDRVLRRSGRLEPNYRGDRIPQSYGLVILVWTVAVFAVIVMLSASLRARALLWLMTCAGYGILGLADDWWGAKSIKGLRGHFRAAVRDHMLTTGLVKAVGGVLLAVGVAAVLKHGWGVQTLVAAGLIALGANAVNLLDLRPGRASGVFLLLSGLLVVGNALVTHSATMLAPVGGPTLVVWRRDSRAEVMMGDTGSNLLGACFGLGAAETCGFGVQCGLMLLLMGMHLVAERISITRVIEQNAFLRALDRLTGVREGERKR